MKTPNIQKGFTIVELLLVIVVISILSAISMVAYPSIQADARDTKRSSRISIISSALEKYYSENGEYPTCDAMTAQPANIVTANTLKTMDYNVLASPTASHNTNSIVGCSGDPTSDVYIYETNGAAYILKYLKENGKTVVATNSRHGSMSESIPLAAPATPVVAANTTGADTTWSWGAATCSTGSARYQYRYTISPSGYDSGLTTTANTSLTFTTSTGAQTYTVSVQAECYNATSSSGWSSAGSASYLRPGATGGSITYNGGYTIHAFTASGTFTVSGNISGAEVLIVGAGRNGNNAPSAGGGGGAGGAGGQILSLSGQSFNNGSLISVTVGSPSSPTSSFGINQASGTGAAGGLASAPTFNGGPTSGGAGASGALSSITGSATYYGGGGGGGSLVGDGGAGGAGGGGAGGNNIPNTSWNYGTDGNSGTPNTGGGGGGAGCGDDQCDYVGGSGGSGIVIARYLTLQ